MIKKKSFALIFCSFLVFGATFANYAAAETMLAYCSVGVGMSKGYINNGDSGTGNAATNFKNTLVDTANVPDAYNINLTRTTWSPSVTRGTPFYQSYVINDNKNGKYYPYNEHNGKYLNDYQGKSLAISTGKKTGYHNTAGQKPTTNLNIRSADGLDCYTKPYACVTFTQATEISVTSF